MSKHQEIHLQTLMLQDPKVSNPMGDACSIEDVLESYQGMDDIDLLQMSELSLGSIPLFGCKYCRLYKGNSGVKGA